MARASRSTRANRRSPLTTFPLTGKTWIQLKKGRYLGPAGRLNFRLARFALFLEEIRSIWRFSPPRIGKLCRLFGLF